LTELEQGLLDTIEQLQAEHREEVRALQRSMRDLTTRLNGLAAQVEGLTSLLQRAVQP
jgi:uncharacterized protein involved in exopolysaccharide biosynthesis